MSSQTAAIAPGARVLIRDAEWIVKRVDRTGTGGQSIQVVGVSQIVRHKEARFLSEIEGKSITVLDPAETELVTTRRRNSGIAACISKACFGSRRQPGTTCGSATARQSMTYLTSSIPRCWRSNNRASGF